MKYKIRISGTSKFVESIDPEDKTRIPPGKVDFVDGWTHEKALVISDKDRAEKLADLVRRIEGVHTSIEEVEDE